MSYIGPLKTSRSLLVLNWKSFGNNACAKFQVDTITGAELDQRSARRYNQRNLQYHQNKMFRNDQKLFYKELDGKTNEQTEAPDPKGSSEVCSKLWSKPVEHNRTKQENVIITAKKLKRALARMSNRKAAGPDHVQGFWFKKATSLHPKLKQHLQKCVNAGAVPTWMTEERTVLIMKYKCKGTVVGNYRLIASLPLMWKLLTSIFSEAMYGHFSC